MPTFDDKLAKEARDLLVEVLDLLGADQDKIGQEDFNDATESIVRVLTQHRADAFDAGLRDRGPYASAW